MNESNLHADPSTIIAVASPPGASERGLLRLSGAGVFETLAAVIESPPPRRRGVFPVRLAPMAGLEASLPAVLVSMSGPRSFTGEDSAEIAVPGNPGLLRLVAEGFAAAARRADVDLRDAAPGEFTARAFLRGRIDLGQAEGIAASIAAASDRELEAASALREGRLARLGTGASDALARLLALVEAGIDFADEEDVVGIEATALAAGLASVRESLEALRDRAVGLAIAATSPRVVLAGPPNAGKSSLFNALLGRGRAVESPIAGTTRDALCEPLRLDGDGREILLIDLAGLDGTDGVIEREARRIALREIERADLVLDCQPGRSGPGRRESAWTTAASVIRVATMSDLEGPVPEDALATSARSGAGLDALRIAIGDRLDEGADRRAADRLGLGARHERGIGEAVEAIRRVESMLESVPKGRGPEDAELVAHRLREALDALAAIGGRVDPDEVLGLIYSSFCIGK